VTIPNPATIAHEIVEGYELGEDTPNADLDGILDEIRHKIAAAIEADRAQRGEFDHEARLRFQVGDLVRLTGPAWADHGMQGLVVRVGVQSVDGASEAFFELNEEPWSILNDGYGDYSASLFRAAND